ncbi:RDD family protein [Virgibacillus sp. NKC19-3]|uniref:RDD family protein n=1 Tax=Virgibacillus saliphilus TaxID=2831674 RepID=UPI001C9B3577|nr:RDD family protein [Virgibacillus sp. NKC19-3]MBY7141534.1 RDD family protein [Virgibacillus sp. NKC19-3]
MNQEEQVAIKTPEFVSLQFKLAGLGSRAGAMIIDQIVLTIFNIVITLFLVFAINADMDLLVTDSAAAIVVILMFLAYWGYFFVCEYFFGGRTLGKRLMGLRVIQDNGHSITLLSSLIRNLLRVIDMIPMYLTGMIMIFFHSKHKRLGDLVAGTLVVHEPRPKKEHKATAIEKEIKSRGLSKESLSIEDGALHSLGIKEWNLLNTYSNRILQLPQAERMQLTYKMAQTLLPKAGIGVNRKNERELENMLLTLYLILKDEWEF